MGSGGEEYEYLDARCGKKLNKPRIKEVDHWNCRPLAQMAPWLLGTVKH